MTEAGKAEWIVIRPEGHIAASALASVFEGEWRRRADLGDVEFLELAGPAGKVRAVPTNQVETSAAGDVAQVWQVPGDTGANDNQHGLDAPPGEPEAG